MNCIYFKRRSKNYKNYFYCSYYKKEIELNDCKNCIKKEYKEIKPIKSYKPIKRVKATIKQRTAKQAKLERDRFSILTNNLNKCIECGREHCEINLHEIFYGTGKRKLSMKYGLVIPLCTVSCHNQVNSIGIHFDKQMCDKWVIKGQKKYMKHYNKTKDEFRKVFGKNYLD